MVGPLIETFEDETGISVDVRWASTPELAATLLEEGQNSPADLFLAQDPGGLGAVDTLLSPLPDEILDRVPEAFQDQNGQWVGITGRVRVVVYNTDRLTPADLPQDMMGFTDPEWKGRIGWAPTNASFQSMVTAMRLVWGEEQTRDWLTGIVENEPIAYEKNTPTVAAVEAGEVDVGFVNHYYLYRFLAEEGESFTARNYFLPAGGPGSVILTSGAGILQSAENRLSALAFLEFLLDERAQQYFAEETFEYPLNPDVRPFADLVPVDDLQIPNLNLSDLAGTRKTVLLLQDVGALP